MAEAVKRLEAPSAVADMEGTVTAIIPCSRGVPVGVRALRAQDVDVSVRVLSNGEGPLEVPGATVRRVAWTGHGQTAAAVADIRYRVCTLHRR